MGSGRFCVLKCLLLIFLALPLRVNSASSACELSFARRNDVFNFRLASPLPKFPHGVLSEDGFYKVSANQTVLWFQLCDGLIFNHNPPRCLDCKGCGGPTHCGMACSALVSNDFGGYDVCTTIGHVSSTHIDVIDKQNPSKGAIVKMSSSNLDHSCSLSVSVVCKANGVEGPVSLEKSGECDYATMLRHPSGCAQIISGHGGGLGWFGTLLIIILCLLGAYLLAGGVYRYFALGIRGIDVIPNVEFWASIPHRIQGLFASLLQRFRGSSHGYQSSYSRV